MLAAVVGPLLSVRRELFQRREAGAALASSARELSDARGATESESPRALVDADIDGML